jgi:hypothetical protein
MSALASISPLLVNARLPVNMFSGTHLGLRLSVTLQFFCFRYRDREGTG